MPSTIAEKANLPKDGNWVGSATQVVKISLLSRLYVWSLVLEPLLFFVLFERTISGVSSNPGRILQIVVMIGLMLRSLAGLLKSSRGGIRMINIASPLYVNYAIYFFLAVFAGLIGILSGAYNLPAAYEYKVDESGFSRWLNSETIRPVFEYFITLYYFAYFTILPRYLLKTKKSVEYFFSVFKAVFIISFVVGVIDLGLASVGIFLVPRHIADWRIVGARFHGLAGEPRQAFVYLFFGLAILHLQAHFRGLTLNKWWVLAIIAAALLTESASGLLGIVFFMGLYGVYSLGRISIQRIAEVGVLFTLIIGLLYVTATNSDRIRRYLESASDLWFLLETGEKLPYLISVQSESIYPLYDLTVKFRNLNMVPILIGSGLGSASVINNIYDPAVSNIDNPSSQFARIAFESGLIGAYFFVMVFVYPVKHLTKHLPTEKRNKFVLLTLLLLGCFFGNRSAVSYIYLGILTAVFRLQGRKDFMPAGHVTSGLQNAHAVD